MKKPFYLVAGLGQTGYSVARYLHKKQLPFVVFDTRKHLEQLTDFSLTFPGVEVFLGDFPSSLYSKVTQVIASPGLSLEEPFLEQAKRHGIPIIGDIECFAQQVNAPVIAITGTNGKSTVTTLVGEMAKAAGIQVAVGGNIGRPILDFLDDTIHYDLWVLELSSFQLDLTFSLAPLAATVLNITPDHLDRHHTLNNYIQAKHRIYNHATHFLYNREDEQTKPTTAASTTSFGLDTPADNQWGIMMQHQTPYLAFGKEPLLSIHSLKLQGKHNWQNALAACALASYANIPHQAMCQVLETFSGLPHRCQTVRQLNQVTWINDSKGTNVGAAISAIEGIGPTLSGKIVLIAGGLGKGADFSPLNPVIKKFVREVVLIGKDAPLLAKALETAAPLTHADTFEAAITLAKQAAEPGDVVLLSPACASMDMFKDYVHRGECFAELVHALSSS
ncbi:MAG: UDP-N-acetylmuramoyl-L-alanine--D-glutamate ligase [Gammaproteobacteria bacterium]|nr:UDP-N-acetylmuramoyl-L-alanine--D-glutamate ligase [Gammaproteobacteria bacterium]